MKSVKFLKMEGSGNDFIVVSAAALKAVDPSTQASPHEARGLCSGFSSSKLARTVCDRKYGVGADGLLVLGNSKKADVAMRIFNADGSEAEMCGNGARCAALYASKKSKKKKLTIETRAGLLSARIGKSDIALKMTNPFDLRRGLLLNVAGQTYEVNYINTGVPHAVIEVDDVERVDVKALGGLIRRHDVFLPAGTNVDFIKILASDYLVLRTYERGVEGETLACGTGSVASAIMAVLKARDKNKQLDKAYKIRVMTRSGEALYVYFKLKDDKISDVWLQGRARIVFKGEYYV